MEKILSWLRKYRKEVLVGAIVYLALLFKDLRNLF